MNILKKLKIERGNTTILVLILALVALFLVSIMVKYVFRDVGFTELDENKLRALNIAEAGISDMYKNLDLYYKEEIDSLPASPYNLDLTSQGEPQGNVVVTYEIDSGSGSVTDYLITAKGVDKSGVSRTVRVKINVTEEGGIPLDIFDYIYSISTVRYNGNDRIIEGPFYCEENLELLANSGFLQNISTGPVIVEGDLIMRANSFINEGPVYVAGDVNMIANSIIKKGTVSFAGNLNMDGNAKIDFDLESPMIVMGNITMKSNSKIGESGKDLALSCPGTISTSANARIYYTPPIGSETFTFNDPGFDLEALINEYKNDVQGSALVIDGNLLLNKNNYPYNNSSGPNSISFNKVGSNYQLNIQGNVIVNGDIDLGNHESAFFNQYIIYYEGKGVLYSTGNIDVYAQVKPLNMGNFPDEDLLILIAEGNIHFIVEEAFFEDGDYDNPHIGLVAIAGGTLTSDIGVAARGTFLAGSLQADTQFNKIYYQDGIKDALPVDIPQQSTGGSSSVTFTQEWQEVVPD